MAVLREWIAPAVVGRELPTAQSLGESVAHYKGNPFAKGLLDAAWWLLASQQRGMALHRMLGAERDMVPVGADFGVADSVDGLLRDVGRAAEAGFRRVKLKFRPGWDLPTVAQVRREFPDLTMHVDCNGGYTLADVDVFKRLDALGLAMIEQPLAYDDLVDHARLAEQIETPICLDESITSVDKARQAISLGSCRAINVKPGRVGGITPSVAIHDLCRAANVTCWVGGMLESAVGARLCIALAMLGHFTYPADIFPSARFYRRDLGRPAVELTPGPDGTPHVAALGVPGVGAEPDPEMLERCTVSHSLVEPR